MGLTKKICGRMYSPAGTAANRSRRLTRKSCGGRPMADTILPQHLPLKLDVHGLCACGCGQHTSIRPRNDRRFGFVKGEPAKFVQGHYARVMERARIPLADRFWSKVNKNGPIVRE